MDSPNTLNTKGIITGNPTFALASASHFFFHTAQMWLPRKLIQFFLYSLLLIVFLTFRQIRAFKRVVFHLLVSSFLENKSTSFDDFYLYVPFWIHLLFWSLFSPISILFSSLFGRLVIMSFVFSEM